RRRHTRLQGDWSSDVCSSDLPSTISAAQLTATEIVDGCVDRPRHPGLVGQPEIKTIAADLGDIALRLAALAAKHAAQSSLGHHRSEERRVGKECRSRTALCGV